jgi:hypothetical protein
MPEYFTSQLGTERTFDILQSGYHYIGNLSAPFTDEVIVRLYPSIEPVEGTPEVQMGDFPGGFEGSCTLSPGSRQETLFSIDHRSSWLWDGYWCFAGVPGSAYAVYWDDTFSYTFTQLLYY